jgi:quercetin dioxygenase-like cupin family protein
MENEFDLKHSITYSRGAIKSNVVIKSTTLNITLFCMAAGTDIDVHTSTKEGTVHVLEGDGIFILGKKKFQMKQGVLIHMKANQPHSIVVKKNTSFLLTLVG